VLGAEHPDTVISMNELARLYWDEHKYAHAEALYIKVLELQRRVLGAEQPRRLSSMTDLAALYLEQGRYTQAEALLREALNGFEKVMPNDWGRYSCQSLLGASLAAQEQYAEAERLLLSGYEGMLDREAIMPFADRFNVKKAVERLIQLYQIWGKPDRVAEWREKLRLRISAVRMQ
jgi:eukaryotic-like serine/threonine-protein kinase